VQQVYLNVNQPDLCCPLSDRTPHSDEHFMPYANTSVFRAWCENKISGILCRPPSNAPWTNSSLAAYILNQLCTIKPRHLLNDFEEIDFLIAHVHSPGDTTTEHHLWLSLLGQFIKKLIERILKDRGINHPDIASLRSLDYISTAQLPIAACQQFYAVMRYGVGNVQASQLFKMFEGFLLARREPVVVVLLGTMETTQFMKMLGALAGESATRHIKVLLCGDVYPSIAPDFREFQLIEADTEYKGKTIN